MRTRRAAWREGSTNGWHDDLRWYAAAVHQMKLLTPGLSDFEELVNGLLEARTVAERTGHERQLAEIARGWSDPRSLGFQSQVHGTFVASGDWPSHSGRRVLWQECAHNHWFFLPWHRAYLLEFENVARAHIADLGGPADTWALPYWNYSDYRTNPNAAELPRPLRGQTLPEGVQIPGLQPDESGRLLNPLFDRTRVMTAGPATGATPQEQLWADATDALTRPHFANRQDLSSVSLGGGYLEDARQFHLANEIGMMDVQPHGSVHGQVGGNMWLFETAGLDPAFWMHHNNVDRLWETYARDLGHGYPFTTPGPPSDERRSWDTHAFRFLRPEDPPVTWTAKQVTDVEELGYTYDSTAAPQFGRVPPTSLAADIDPFGFAPGDLAPEPVAAALGVPLAGAVDVFLTSGSDDDGFGFTDEVIVDGTRWVLRFDGIRATRPAPTSYLIYLGLDADEAADPDDRTHYVGLLSLFGVHEATRDDGTSSGSGRVRFFDATFQVTSLGPGFDPLHPNVRLVPLNPGRDLAGAAMSIERITLEVA
jgi:tyrosinase